jgi:chromate transporter
VTLQSFVIIYIISQFLEGSPAIKWIAGAFQGIKLAVGLLIIDAAVKMMAKMDRRTLKVGIMVVSLSCVVLANALGRHVSSVMLMLAAAVVGEAVYLADKVKAERKVRG